MNAARTVASLVLLALAAAAGDSAAQTVLRPPDAARDLPARWEWAGRDARAAGRAQSWIGYSIVRMMDENSYIGSFSSDERDNHPSLGEVLTGLRQERTGPGGGSHGRRRVPKEVALLFSVGASAPGGAPAVTEVRMSNLSLRADLGEAPLYWLGAARPEESLSFLASLLREAPSTDVRIGLVEALGLHGGCEGLFPLLSSIARGDGVPEARSRAAFALGGIATPASLALLAEMARKDQSEEVREQAVFAVSQMDSGYGMETLIGIARERGLRREVRSRAAFWLGQAASAKALRALKAITEEDDDADVQRQALFALAQSDTGGVEAVIAVARGHGSPRLRRDAIFWLGQSEDPRALDALVAILRE
jgi:hypothetical protein